MHYSLHYGIYKTAFKGGKKDKRERWLFAGVYKTDADITFFKGLFPLTLDINEYVHIGLQVILDSIFPRRFNKRNGVKVKIYSETVLSDLYNTIAEHHATHSFKEKQSLQSYMNGTLLELLNSQFWIEFVRDLTTDAYLVGLYNGKIKADKTFNTKVVKKQYLFDKNFVKFRNKVRTDAQEQMVKAAGEKVMQKYEQAIKALAER